MSSVKKNSYSKPEPLFERDPHTGKLKPLPLPAAYFDYLPAQLMKSSEKKRRQKIDLKPLKLSIKELEEFSKPSKMRKLDLDSGRKISRQSTRISQTTYGFSSEFSKPSKMRKLVLDSGRKISRQSTRISQTTRRVSNTLNRENTLTKIPISSRQSTNVVNSPLLNLEVEEDRLLKTRSVLKGYPFKSPKLTRSQFQFSQSKKVRTPLQMSRISEEDSKLIKSDSGKKGTKRNCEIGNIQSVVGTIKSVIESEEIAFKEYQKKDEDNMSKLNCLLEDFSNDKENLGADPENILIRITAATGTSEDLRITALKNNLIRAEQPTQSPRTKNALSLYNSMRVTCPVLETPKLNRSNLADCTIKSSSKNLSDALLDQCLLLQGTPRKQ